MDIRAEIIEWESRVRQWLGTEAELVHVSSLSTDIRIYRKGNRLLKIRRLTAASMAGRPNTFEDEYAFLQWISAKGTGKRLLTPRPVAYRVEAGWEAVEMEAVNPPVITDPVISPHRESMRDILATLRAVWQLSRLGVSHGDLLPDNLGRNSDGEYVALDFDQAVFGHWSRCLLRDLVGVPFLGRASKYNLLDRL